MNANEKTKRGPGRPKQRIVVQCATCGQDLERRPSEIAASRTGRFFHPECEGNHNPRKGRTGECEFCGDEYYARPSQAGKRFCSQSCAARSRKGDLKLTQPCLHCETNFESWPSENRKFCSRICWRDAKLVNKVEGEFHNGRPIRLHSQGYRMVYEPGHPEAGLDGWAHEHRWVAAEQLNGGEPLAPGMEVHHRNGDHLDNRSENLEIMSMEEHRSLHLKAKHSHIIEDQAMADFLRSNPDLLAAFEASRLG